MARNALRSLRNEDYSDRELLHICADEAGTDGWTTTDDLASVIGISAPPDLTGKYRTLYAKRCIATRFSWMVRFGWVERDEDRTSWRVTRIGRDLMNGNLDKSLEKNLGKLSAGDRVLVMRHMTQGYRSSRDEAAAMLRREWQHGISAR